MKAVCWYGIHDVRLEQVPDPILLNPRDVILKVTSSSVCGSDLHLYDGVIPTMQEGDIIGHEFMGEVVEVGRGITTLRRGDRVVVPSPISCGHCYFCGTGQYSLCDNSNPNAWMPEKVANQAGAAIFGYSHAFGGYAGAFADYVRVPFADVGAFKVPEALTDDQVLFVSDAMATGYMAADFCAIQPGQTVAVWGSGAVGLFAMKSAWVLGAGRVIAIDRVPHRLQAAREHANAETLNFDEVDVVEALKDTTGGRGPDACIEAVGMEADQSGLEGAYDRVKATLKLETGRPYAVREAIRACRKGGIVSIVGVFGGMVDKFPLGIAMNKGLTFRMAQQHGQKYAPELLRLIQDGRMDGSFAATHHYPLDKARDAFEISRKREDGVIRVVFKHD